MGYEFDPEMQSRLVRHYQQVSDEMLLEAAAQPEDLTPMAQEVVRAEVQVRGLKPSSEKEAAADIRETFGAAHPGMSKPEFGSAIERGRIALITLYDAIEAGQACGALEERSIEVELRDLSQTEGRGSYYGGRPVALQLVVRQADREEAVKTLRAKMGLFPLEQIAEPDMIVDDGTMATVGQFARRADAEEVARVLTEAKVWNRVTENPEGSAETEDAYLVEVREVDLFEAGDLVEKALELPEG